MNKIPKFTDNGIEYIDLDTLEQKISSINENRLYHFTSFDNFIKIWLSKSLLFSKRDGMNVSIRRNAHCMPWGLIVALRSQ